MHCGFLLLGRVSPGSLKMMHKELNAFWSAPLGFPWAKVIRSFSYSSYSMKRWQDAVNHRHPSTIRQRKEQWNIWLFLVLVRQLLTLPLLNLLDRLSCFSRGVGSSEIFAHWGQWCLLTEMCAGKVFRYFFALEWPFKEFHTHSGQWVSFLGSTLKCKAICFE